MSERGQKGESEQPPVAAQPAAPTRPSVKPVAAQPAAKSAISRPPPLPARGAAPQPTPSREARLHVSVKSSARDPNLFIVRPLAEGQRAPTGTREAYLVLLEVEAPPNTANGGNHHER
jgi:hypothetical protein